MPFNLLFGTDVKVKDDISIHELVEKELIHMCREDRDELKNRAKENIRQEQIQQENRREFNKRRKSATSYIILVTSLPLKKRKLD